MAAATQKFLAWDEETYHSKIPLAETVFREVRENPPTEEAYKALESIFLKHRVHEKLVLCVVHRHFELQSKEQLVHFNNVATPWRVDESPDYLQPNVRPKAWAFVENETLFPYEFEFVIPIDNSISAPDPPFPAAFAAELYKKLNDLGMERMYGIVQLKPDDVHPPPRSMEFTAGRASVIVPMTEEMEKMEKVQASWYFPCSRGMFGSAGTPWTKICQLVCRDHSKHLA